MKYRVCSINKIDNEIARTVWSGDYNTVYGWYVSRLSNDKKSQCVHYIEDDSPNPIDDF